jgi:hypothetical protein
MKYINVIIDILIILQTIMISSIIMLEGFDITLAGIHIQANHLKNPLIILASLVLLKIIIFLLACFRHKTSSTQKLDITKIFFLILAIVSFLLSLGPVIRLDGQELGKGPFYYLYLVIPGLKGIRGIGRFYILFMISLGILAAYGMRRIQLGIPRVLRRPVTLLVILLVVVECWNVNLPMNRRGPSRGYFTPHITSLPSTQSALPPEYKWLIDRPQKHIVLELPFDSMWFNFEYEYFASFHKHCLVNGESGYSPATKTYINHLMHFFPDEESVKFLQELGVDIIILHRDRYPGDKRIPLQNALKERPELFTELLDLPHVRIYKLKKSTSPFLYDTNELLITNITGKRISLTQSAFESSMSGGEYSNLIDGTAHSIVVFEKQYKEQWLEVKLPDPRTLAGLVLHQWIFPQHSPAGLSIFSSMDGETWELAWQRRSLPITLPHLVAHAGNFRWNIPLDNVKARYLKIVQTGQRPNCFWGINELEILESSD